ncbi:hypothetical protein [Microtetraspora malaysiensis]|uniref:hypothetical protein n=1 Tax=Microtetraspora malaysiensis TaxID=161358 RepID=UPI003D8ACD09
MEETNEPLELVERVATIDIGKTGLVVCVRVPHDITAGDPAPRPGRHPHLARLDAVSPRSQELT